MGCVSSSNASGGAPPGEDIDEAGKIAKAQRRKLSVAPQHEGGGGVDKNAVQNRKASVMDWGATAELTEIELKSKGDLEVVAKSNKGHVPYSKKKVNQDRPMVKFALGSNPELSLFGVMDGHGEFGHDVAEFVKVHLPTYLEQQVTQPTAKSLKDDTENGILAGVKNCVDALAELNAQKKINTAFSGTTCVFGIKNANSLYVANIGDSRCVLCRQKDGSDIDAIDLSFDQKPENPEEKKRILAAGGRVEPLPGPPGEDCGPPRVWLKEVDVPGLAMSRSIGDDISQTVGVISVPEIIKHELQENDIFAVWASDGVWEFISSKEAIDIVWKHKDNFDVAVDKLCNEATKRWKEEEEVIDDITAVIVQFNKPK